MSATLLQRFPGMARIDIDGWLASIFAGVDRGLLASALALLTLGVIMVASSSVAVAEWNTGDALYYLKRQSIFFVLALALALSAMSLPLIMLERLSFAMLVVAVVLLLLVLVPGAGVKVNGSTRWIELGVFRLQVSEPARLLVIIYMAGYLVRRMRDVSSSLRGVMVPLAVLGVIDLMLLAQPDLGAAVLLSGTVMGMLLLGGVAWRWLFALLALAAVLLALMIWIEPYRMDRLLAFQDPWADPYGNGYQPIQALLAIGGGGWTGLGLGNSVQKLFYLPEAHTDYIFAVYAEEFGLFGVLVLLIGYGMLVWRGFVVARQAADAGRLFAAYLAWGLSIWFGLQAATHIAVNLGLLPPKGLTLPLMSYGGSSLLVMAVVVGLLLRISHETQSPRLRRRQVSA